MQIDPVLAGAAAAVVGVGAGVAIGRANPSHDDAPDAVARAAAVGFFGGGGGAVWLGAMAGAGVGSGVGHLLHQVPSGDRHMPTLHATRVGAAVGAGLLGAGFIAGIISSAAAGSPA